MLYLSLTFTPSFAEIGNVFVIFAFKAFFSSGKKSRDSFSWKNPGTKTRPSGKHRWQISAVTQLDACHKNLFGNVNLVEWIFLVFLRPRQAVTNKFSVSLFDFVDKEPHCLEMDDVSRLFGLSFCMFVGCYVAGAIPLAFTMSEVSFKNR